MLQRHLFSHSPSAHRLFDRLRRRLRPIYESDMQKHRRERQNAEYLLLSLTNCGRTWLRLILGRAMQLNYAHQWTHQWAHLYPHQDSPLKDVNLHDLYSFSERVPTLPSIKPMHEKFGQFGNSYERQKVILLVRDPRDAIVSRYHQHKDEIAQTLGYEDLDSYVCESEDLPAYIQFYNDWRSYRESAKALLVVRYEDMKADTFECIQRVCDFLDLPVTSAEMREAIDYASFQNMRKMELEGSTQVRASVMLTRNLQNPKSFKVRKGSVGGYRAELQSESVAWVDHLVAAQLNPVYGYVGHPADRLMSYIDARLASVKVASY